MATNFPSLVSATTKIDSLYRSTPDKGTSDRIADQAMKDLLDAQSAILHAGLATQDEENAMAEFYYQRARLGEYSARFYPGVREVLGMTWLATAKGDYEEAVKRSKEGRKSKLSYYEAELAAFLRRYPNA